MSIMGISKIAPRTILIEGKIEEGIASNFLKAIALLEEVDKISLQKEDIEIMVNSVGGDVAESFTIVDKIEILKQMGYNVITTNIGRAYSAAATIALSGSTRQSYKSADYMLHDLSLSSEGTLCQIQEVAHRGVTLRDKYHNFILRYTNIQLDDLIQWENSKYNKYISAEELMELKGVDIIL